MLCIVTANADNFANRNMNRRAIFPLVLIVLHSRSLMCYRLFPFERTDSINRKAQLLQPPGAAKIRQVYHGCNLNDFRTHTLNKACCSQHGAAGGNQVINQNHLVARFEGVFVDLDGCSAVLQLVIFCQCVEWQLTLLSDQYQRGVKFVSQSRANDKTAGVHGSHRVNTLAMIAMNEGINEFAKCCFILQNSGYVTEGNTRLRPVWYGADSLLDTL